VKKKPKRTPRMRQLCTIDELMARVLETIKRMTPREKADVRKHLDEAFPKKKRARAEYGPSTGLRMMSGLAAAAKQLAREEKTMAGPLASQRVQ